MFRACFFRRHDFFIWLQFDLLEIQLVKLKKDWKQKTKIHDFIVFRQHLTCHLCCLQWSESRDHFQHTHTHTHSQGLSCCFVRSNRSYQYAVCLWGQPHHVRQPFFCQSSCHGIWGYPGWYPGNHTVVAISNRPLLFCLAVLWGLLCFMSEVPDCITSCWPVSVCACVSGGKCHSSLVPFLRP